MRHIRRSAFPASVTAGVATALLLAQTPALAADTSGSMRVGDLQYGNLLDPGGYASALSVDDPLGLSLLHDGVSRTPTGFPYLPPALIPELQAGAWRYNWGIEGGYTVLLGDDDAQFFRQYADWTDGPVLGLGWLDAWNPDTGAYLDGRASWLGDDDRYLRLRGGRYGKYRIEGFFRDMPHVITTTAFPLWEGIGTDTLTLPDGLTPGNSTAADVKAASDAAPRRTLRVTRTRAGVSIEGELGRDWVGYGALVNERREGTRLWGGSFFFNYPFADNGGVLETVRPIDFSTTDASMGARWAGQQWRFNAVYNGSFFRNDKTVLNYENPFLITPVTGTPASGLVGYGQFSLEPDNDAHNLRLELSRNLPQQGELSLTAAGGTMRQNDTLIAPVNCQGRIGIDLSPGPDYSIDCADWNTPASLSQPKADARIDTLLINAKASFRPTEKAAWHLQLRRYDEDNKTSYLARNPLTGEYGYITENGSMGTVVPGEMGIFDPDNPLYASYFTKIRSLPVGYTDTTAELGGDYNPNLDTTISLTYSHRHYEPDFRERKYTDEHRIQAAFTDRQALDGTLRLSYEYAERDGDGYNHFPYAPFYSVSIPGFVVGPNAVPFTVDAMRKYDLSDRSQHKFRAIYTRPVGEAATLSGTLYGLYNDYDTLIGRKGDNATGITLQSDYQPTPQLTLNASAGAELSRLRIANVADDENVVSSNPALGGAKYPFANVWTENDRERSLNANLQLSYQWVKTRFDGGYNFVDTRGRIRYDYASPAAVAGAQQAYLAGTDPFPDNRYQLHSFDLGLTRTLSAHWTARLFGRYEMGKFADWHYSGFDTTLVYDHRVYSDRGPAARFDAGIVGLMFRYTP